MYEGCGKVMFSACSIIMLSSSFEAMQREDIMAAFV